jgi:hypothetical protein
MVRHSRMPVAHYQSPIFVGGTEECLAMLTERKNCHDELFTAMWNGLN